MIGKNIRQMSRSLSLAGIFVFFAHLLLAEKVSDLSAALDLTGQTGIELVSFYKRVYNVIYDKEWEDYDYVYNPMTGEPTYKETSNDGWKVQSSNTENSKYSTYPIKGSSCLRSGLKQDLDKSSDAQEARLVFKVYGPGTFSFFYKTSCNDWGDALTVYVDDEPQAFNESGYGPNSEYNWVYRVDARTGEELEVENRAEIIINGGKATSGGYGYTGTYYHKVEIVFEKDLPKMDWEGKNYLPDGPEKPDKDWYEGDSEGYQEALAEYKALLALFFNSVWIDWVKWTPLPLTLELDDAKSENSFDEAGDYLDKAIIILSSTAPDMGYSVRYTLDGSNPTSSSPEFNYEMESYLTLTHSCTLKAAVFVQGKMDATIGIVSKEVTIKASDPRLEKDAEHSTETAFVFKATNQYADNIIVYTTDGTEPMMGSAVYDSLAGIVIATPCTVKTRCVREGVISSEIVAQTVEKLLAPTYRLLDADNNEETYGVTAGIGLMLEVDNPTPSLKYGFTEANISTPFPETGLLLVGAGEAVYIRQAEEGKLASEIVRIEVKKADTTIVFGEGDYALKQGWNLVSFPVYLTNASCQALLGKWNLFGYDGTHKCYQRATKVTPGHAYWVFQNAINEAVGVELNGYMAVTSEPVTAGWNLLGLVKGQTTFGGNEIWSYSNGAFTLLKSGQKPSLWKGYMVKKK